MGKLLESIEYFKFVLYKARISGGFASRKDSHARKLQQRNLVVVKLHCRELYDSKLSGLNPFGNLAISLRHRNQKERH